MSPAVICSCKKTIFPAVALALCLQTNIRMILRCSLVMLTDKTTATKSVSDLVDGAVNSAIARDNRSTTAEGSVMERSAHAYVHVFSQVQLFHPSDSVLTVLSPGDRRRSGVCVCVCGHGKRTSEQLDRQNVDVTSQAFTSSSRRVAVHGVSVHKTRRKRSSGWWEDKHGERPWRFLFCSTEGRLSSSSSLSLSYSASASSASLSSS